jgi:hypothetical protein
MVADWHSLNANEPGAQPSAAQASDLRQEYAQAVTYQLQMLTEFVLNNRDEHSLFVLIGDHQPPRVSRRADGWATPIHIISRDPALVDHLAEYGFSPGLRVRTLEPTLHHEGVYSLLVRLLMANDGDQQIALPTYLPNGAAPAAPAAHAAN